MYERHWGLTASPFRSPLDPRWFHESAVHEEALSRLLYLTEQRRRCGLLSGPAGTGKSLLLRVLAEELRSQQQYAVCLDLPGATGGELLRRLCMATDIYPVPASAAACREAFCDHWATLAAFGQHVSVLLDGLEFESASEGTLAVAEWLTQLTERADGCLTVVIATRSARLPRPAVRIAERLDLRAELAPFSLDQTMRYLSDLLQRAGRDEEVFGPDAVRWLHRAAAGVPRTINRLADLALLAGMGDGTDRVSVETLAQVAAELSPECGPADAEPVMR